MSFSVEQRDREGIVVLDLKGPLTLGQGDSERGDALLVDEQNAVNPVLN